MDPLDLFISHSSTDVAVARDLKAVLDEAGYSSFIAPDDVTGTDTWTEQILDAIKRSRAMIVLVSAAANRSTHVSREVNLALARQRPVLPVRIEQVGPEGSLEYLLSLVQRVDAFPAPIKNHERAILRRVEALLATVAGDAEDAETPAPAPAEAPAQPPVLGPGSTIGGFTIVDQVGEGGQATVYRAHQREPKREVALKVIRADQRDSAADRSRFLEEQDTLAGLEHPGIVPIFAAGEEHGVLFIAMRLIDGPDLGARLRADGHLTAEDTAGLLRPVAKALDFAHQRGVIHRDVKPSNILIDSGGLAYLSDFGLGRRTGDRSTTTPAGVVVGTLEYMAPEQFTDEDAVLTPAADIYALGCVAYACLSGHPPFTGATPDEVAVARGRGVPSLGTSRPDLPAALDDVLARAVAAAPGERYPSASELVEALAVAGANQQTRPIPVPTNPSAVAKAQAWVRANTPVAAIGGVAGLLVLAFVASSVLGGGPGASASPSRHADTLPTPTPRVATPAPVPTPAPTPTSRVATPPATPLPDTYPSAAELRLIADLPQGTGIQGGCLRFPDRYQGTTAGISCDDPSGGTARLYYQSWPDKASMKKMYEQLLTGAGVATGVGKCVNGVPAAAEWNLGDNVRQGDLACYAEARSPGRVSYLWTHDGTLVMTFWSAPTNTAGYEFWKKWVTAPR